MKSKEENKIEWREREKSQVISASKHRSYYVGVCFPPISFYFQTYRTLKSCLKLGCRTVPFRIVAK